jgi:hypothetical protein
MGRFLGISPIGKLNESRLFKKMALKAFKQCDKVGFTGAQVWPLSHFIRADWPPPACWYSCNQ